MSTTIDERVVEMRFDNSHFEKNTRTTMSTLDKLKEKLNLTGASKGLENLSSSAKKVDMSGLSSGIETVSSKFSVMEIVGVTALVNLANSAVEAGKRFVKALTVEPVSDGWREYEMTLNAVQTTMAGTGKSAEEVEKELKKLDEYADKTVYSTADMLNNLPKFTNAGVELEKATKAMIGIANATALAGGDAGKASIAFYNLGQAIGTGYLTRMDYNSINNAGIATMKWKEQMVEAAIAQGTLTKVGEDAYKAGNKTLTLQQLFIDGLQEQWATTDVMMKVFSDYGDETTDIGKKAYDAAQDIKTFSMMMDSLKATAGTGWKDTWQIIFGDLDEAKEFWTGLTNFISGIITRMADFRNNLLSGALTFNPFSNLMKKLNDSGVGKAIEKIDGITKSLEYYQEMVNKIWKGDYKNQPFREGLLEDEGHNFKVLQTLVNKGYQYKLTIDDVTEAEKKFGITAKETTKILKALSDAELRSVGLTDAEIKLYRQLEDQSKKTGESIDEIIAKMEQKDGRSLLIEGLSNAGSGLVGVFKAIGIAWSEVFGLPTSLDLYNGIDGFNKFSESLRLTDKETGKLNDKGQKFVRIFKGVFALVDTVMTIFAGPIGIAFKLVGQFLKALDAPILDTLAYIGDGLVIINEMVNELWDFTPIFEALAPIVKNAAVSFKEWLQSLPKSDWFTNLVGSFDKLKVSMADWITTLGTLTAKDIFDFFKNLGPAIKNALTNINEDFGGVPGDIIAGLANGLKDGAKKVLDAIVQLAKNIVSYFTGELDINSPSKVFFAIGGFIIAGLVGGLLSGGTEVGKTIQGIASSIGEFFKNIDWGKVFTAGVGMGMLYAVKKTMDILTNVTAPLGGLGELFEGVGTFLVKTATGVKQVLKAFAKVEKAFASVLNGIAFKYYTEGFKNLAVSILILAGAVIAIAQIDDIGKIWNAVGVIATLAIVFGILALAMSKISQAGFTISKEGKITASGLTGSLISIGLALLAMAAIVKIIGDMDPSKIDQGFGGLFALVAMLAGLFAAYGLLIKGKAAQNMDKAGKMLRKMATTLLLMVAVVKLVSFLQPEEMLKGAAFALGFLAFTAGLLAISMIPGKSIDKLGGMLAKVSLAMLLMVVVMKAVKLLNVEEFLNGIAFMTAFLVFIKFLVSITKIGKDDSIAKLGGTLLSMSLAMLLMIGVIKLLGFLNADDVGRAILFGAGFLIFLALLVSILKIGKEEQIAKVGLTILALSVAIGLLVGVIALAGMLDDTALLKGLAVVSVLSLLMAAMIAAAKGVNDVKGSIFAMVAAIAVMGLAVGLLAHFCDIDKLLVAMTALSMVMGMFALIETCSKDVTSSMGTIFAMATVLAVLGATLILLAMHPWEQIAAAGVSLSLVMLAMAGVLKIISKMGASIKDALQGVLGMAALCVPLVAVAGILMMMDNAKNAIPNAAALTIMLGALTGVLALLGVMQKSGLLAGSLLGALGLLALCVPLVAVAGILILMNHAKDAMGAVLALSLMLGVMTGVLALLGLIGTIAVPALIGVGLLLALCVPLVALAGILILMNLAENVIDNIIALSTLLLVMTGVLGLLGLISPLAIAAIPAVGALIVVITALTGFIVALGALMTYFPQIEQFVDSGISLLVKLAGGLGEMIGAFVNGIASQIAAGLPAIGTNLSLFMINAIPFIVGAKMIDDQVVKGITALAGAILALTAADVLSGVASFFTGGVSFAELGTELSKFITNAMPFIILSRQVDPAVMEGVKSLAEAVLILTGVDILEGLTGWLTGGNSLANFGSQLGELGTSLNSFVTNLGTFTESQVTTVSCAAQAIKALAEAAKTMPNEGGLWQDMFGTQSLSTFASHLPLLGTNLSAFVTNLGTFNDGQVQTVDCAGKAIKALAEAAKEMPNEDGLWQYMFGTQSLSTFASHLPLLGTNLASFVTNLGTFNDSQVQTVNAAGNAVTALATAAKNMPNEEGLWQKIFGSQSLSTFASHLPVLGTGLAGFVANLGTFTNSQVSTVISASNAIRAIAGLGALDLNETGKNLKGFGDKLVNFGKKVKEYVDKIGEAGSEGISASIANVKQLINMATLITYINTDAVKTFGNSLKTFAKDAIDGFIDTFADEQPKTDMETALKDLVQAGIDGAEAKKDPAKDAFEGIAEDAVDQLSSEQLTQSAIQAGKDLVTGFAAGILSNQSIQKVTNAGSYIGKIALKAAKEAIDSNSPSKEAMKIGNYFGEGFAIGIKDYASEVYGSSFDVAEQAKTGLSKAIARISDVINSDMDTQPTIRPVLDLSDVESGAGYLSSMFNDGPSIGVMANLRSISSGINARNQNGLNDDVVSAIDSLRKDLGNVGRDTYNINGITYDDGSNITEAVKSLIRAAKVERRT